MLTVNGYAKINLTLDILGKRADGYHEVEMIMQTVELHDSLELAKRPTGIELNADAPGLPLGEKNLAWQAADLILGEHLPGAGVHIGLTKRIPMAAGLAGGSADAAAVLRGVNELYDLKLPPTELCRLGARLGSDIPFCIMGGTMMATGRGEVLRRLPDFAPTWVVLAKPEESVSTAWAYRKFDEIGANVHPSAAEMERKIAAGDVGGAAKLVANVLENAVCAEHEIISQIKKVMLDNGAAGALMSGSGSAVFALAESEDVAEKIAAALPEVTTWVTKTIQELR